MIEPDVPSPIDLRTMEDARAWERTAMLRPFREAFFAAFTQAIQAEAKTDMDILELGSGPGFLAHYILSRVHDVHYTLLDFSAPMHTLARQRLSDIMDRHVDYTERSFKEADWVNGISPMDIVVTNQAVHELRHKRYAPAFFVQVRQLLKPDGILLYCDHYEGDDGMRNDQLYMSRAEQRQALALAGFTITELLVKGGRALYRAR